MNVEDEESGNAEAWYHCENNFILPESNAIILFEKMESNHPIWEEGFDNRLICFFCFPPTSTPRILPALRSSVRDTTPKPWQHSVAASIRLEETGREMRSVSPRMKSVTSKSRCLGLWVLPCQHQAPHRWQADRSTYTPVHRSLWYLWPSEVPGTGQGPFWPKF